MTQCIECGKRTTQPILEVTFEGEVILVGPVCRDCWEKVMRSIDEKIYRRHRDAENNN